jgi:hypothetical protein
VRPLPLTLTLLASVFVSSPLAVAERPTEKRSDAAYVVEGTVESVDVTKEDGVEYYLVAIKVAKVHKGDFTAGNVFKVSCFQVKKFKAGTTGAAGHNAIPSKGDKVKAYASKYEQRGGREALYPNWFDKLDKDGPAKK